MLIDFHLSVLIFLLMLLFLFVVGPLMNNLVCEIDRVINKLRLKYRTYIIEYDVEDVGSRSCYNAISWWFFFFALMVVPVLL